MFKKLRIGFLTAVLLVCFGSSLSAATPGYIVVSIPEEKSNRGYYPKSLYRDSSCMCGKDTATDYIFEFYVPGSYNSVYPDKLDKLRITGTNNFADCFIPNNVSARVYKNDTIRACIGFWSAYKCGIYYLGIFPCKNDVAIWMTK